MVEPKPSIVLPVILIAVVLVAAGVGTFLLYEKNHPKSSGAAWTVSVGSNVTVNYIGSFGSGAQKGRVFDTSIFLVAVNNASYPKSVEFSYRGSKANYTPLGVSVGPAVPTSGYSIDNITFGGVVTGFWQGLIGLEVGQTSTITIPPSLGYGLANSSCFVTKPLIFTIPVLISVPAGTFSSLYPGVNASSGTHFTAPTYGWPALVLSANSTAVVVENLPSVGWSVPSIQWPQVVTGLNTTTITLTNELTSADAGVVAGHVSGTGVCGATEFIVSGVNTTAGTYIQDFNREVVGQTLVFTVSIVARY
ncbi:MAG TPA: FKBP-type peptidyl-prolyl cis-trans isomerase [Thermoplasmata archaeon]|nr:FKBP-type peptidyl-prolyl cis-trans isomerase [Thermoplasmata archaeon]